MRRREPSKNQTHRFTQGGYLLPVNLLLRLRHEHGANSGALRPENISPQGVADEDGLLRPEPGTPSGSPTIPGPWEPTDDDFWLGEPPREQPRWVPL